MCTFWVVECENDCAGVVQLLLDLKADVDALDKHGYTPLCVAATSGNTKVIDVLHRNGANINHVAYNDDTAIYLSARKGNKEIVRKLAALGARPTVKNFEDIAEWGSTQLLDILKSADVDFTIRDSDNISILHLAALTANTPVVAWLLNNSSLDIDTEDFIGSTALHYAISTGSLPLVRTLVKHGANVNAKDIFDATPLYFAFYWKRLNVAKYLLSKGAKI
uniref:Unkown protein n=1 Tax=Riptortus pedestris TaxID=329032 RepID=R4WPH5_RIPPE|nr:unkown protein [Riptortus pedestris]